MFGCPHCHSEAKISDVALLNAEHLQKPVRVRTKCCSKIVVLRASIAFTIEVDPNYEKGDKDDWGE